MVFSGTVGLGQCWTMGLWDIVGMSDNMTKDNGVEGCCGEVCGVRGCGVNLWC